MYDVTIFYHHFFMRNHVRNQEIRRASPFLASDFHLSAGKIRRQAGAAEFKIRKHVGRHQF